MSYPSARSLIPTRPTVTSRARVPCLIQHRAAVSPCRPSGTWVLTEALLLAWTSLARLSSSWALAFLASSLAARAMALSSCQVPRPCSSLCLLPLRACLWPGAPLPPGSLRAFWPGCPLVGTERSGAWRRGSLTIQQLSWAPLASAARCQGTLPSGPWKRPECAVLKAGAVSPLLPALGILNSAMSWSLEPRLPLSSTAPRSPSSGGVPLLVGSSVTWRRPLSATHLGASWAASALLGCPPSRSVSGPP